MSIQVTVLGVAKAKARIKMIRAKTDNAVQADLETIGNDLTRYIVEQKLSGTLLKRRTGNLARSIHPKREGLTERVFTNSIYARVHEYSGDIRPVNKKWLTIPTEAALTPAGVLRAPAPAWTGLWFELDGPGRASLWQRQNGKPVKIFDLRKKVHIPERSYLRSSLRENKTQIINRLQGAVKRAMA